MTILNRIPQLVIYSKILMLTDENELDLFEAKKELIMNIFNTLLLFFISIFFVETVSRACVVNMRVYRSIFSNN